MQSYRPERHSVRHYTLVVALGCLVAAAGCGPMGPLRSKASDTWTRTYSLSKTGVVSIANVNGRVEVEGVDGSTVEVSAERIARAVSDQLAGELLERIQIDDRSTPDSVSLETRRVEGILIGASFEVRYHVKVPRAARVRATTVNGGIDVKALEGRLTAHTTNGGIVATQISGGVEARVVNGGVRVQLAAVGKDDVVMATVNGGVRLALPETAKANVTATWVNGGIKMTGLKLEVREDSRRHFEGVLNGGGASIRLNTVNGGITIGSDAGEDFKAERPEDPAHEPIAR